MKTNRRLLLTLVCPLLLTGCSSLFEPTTPVHEHTFKSEWSYNDTMHWREASCEHAELTTDLGEHTFNDEGKCSVCNMPLPSYYKRVTFNGTNLTLNAEPFYKENTLVNMSIVPMEGYTLPKEVEVTGLSSSTYNENTGVITGLVADDIVITATATIKGATYYYSKEQLEYKTDRTELNEVVRDITTYNLDVEEKTLVIESIHETRNDYSNREIKDKHEYRYNDDYQKISYARYYYSDEKYELIESHSYEYNDKGLLSIEKQVGGRLTTYEYDEFNRIVHKWVYENEDDELPSYRHEYTYFADHYEYKYYSGSDVPFLNYSYYETIDELHGLRYVYKYFGDKLDIIGTYDLKTGKLLTYDLIYRSFSIIINENGDQLRAETRYSEDTEVISQEQSNIYDDRGYLQYIDVTDYDNNGLNPVYSKVVYEHNEDMYVTGYTTYSDAEPAEVLETRTFEVSLFNKAVELPLELKHAYTKGCYPSLLSGYTLD